MFRNPRDTSIISHLNRQMNGGKEGILQKAYIDATKNNPNSYIHLDMSQQQKSYHQIRSNIFPESCVIYLSN